MIYPQPINDHLAQPPRPTQGQLWQFLIWILRLTGLGLSLWIILPAPTEWLLPLAVGSPEISPWLGGLNSLGLGLTLVSPSRHRSLALACSALALGLSLWPLGQIAAASQAAESALVNALGPEILTIMASHPHASRPHPFSLKAALGGIAIPKTGRHLTDIPFAAPDGVPLTLDLYQPPETGVYPAIVMLYGGAWQRGQPKDNASFGRYMAAQGYVVWAISYRHAPAHRFPAQQADVQAALAFLQQHADEYETDPTRIALLGRSAGAHLAMLAAYGSGIPGIRAVVDYYGPVDLLRGYYHPPFPDPLRVQTVLETLLGGPPTLVGADRYRAASPIYAIAAHLPPTLLIYGGKDHIVELKFGQAMADRLQAAGNPAAMVAIPWADHAFDAVFNGVSNQFALYYTERFLAWTLR